MSSLAAKPVSRDTHAKPEFAFLVACCNPSTADHSGVSLDTINWPLLFEFAQHHGAIARVTASLERLEQNLPAAVLGKFQDEVRAATRTALWLTREMFRILEQFKARNVDALPYKGPVLAELLYGDVAARQFNDIDILIRARDIPIAVAGLHELGYEPGITLTPRQARAYLRSGYEYTFDGPHGRNLIEVQWNLLPHFYSVDVNMEDLFARSQAQSISGRSVQSLSPEDLLIVLCLHAAKHAWTQLSWLSDIATLATDRRLDWDFINNTARKLRIQKILGVTFLLCERLWGVSTRANYVLPRSCDGTIASLTGKMESAEEPDAESLPYFRTMLQVREARRDQCRFLWRLSTTPSIGEWSAISLPGPLFPLYRVVRGLRLADRMLR